MTESFLTISEMRQCAVAEVHGNVSTVDAERVFQDLYGLIARGVISKVVVDLSKVQTMGSAAYEKLVQMKKLAKKLNGDVRIAAPSSELQYTMGFCGYKALFKQYTTQEDAVGSF